MHDLRVHSVLAPEAAALYEALARHLASAAGLTASFASGGYGPFDRGEPDVVLVCSPPYVAMRAAADPAYELLGAPVLADPRFGGQPMYASELIVRADCGAEALEDLRGAAVAYNEPRSWSGHWALRLRLARAGERGGFFGRSVRAGYHKAALAAVIAGEAAAAAIDAHLLELLQLRDRALPGRIRVLETLEPAPIQPVLV